MSRIHGPPPQSSQPHEIHSMRALCNQRFPLSRYESGLVRSRLRRRLANRFGPDGEEKRVDHGNAAVLAPMRSASKSAFGLGL